MPVIDPVTPPPPAPEPEPIRITAPEYRGVTVDTKFIPSQELLAHIAGSKWTIEYFSQVVDKDSPLSSFSLEQSPVNQQYRRVKKFELRVTADLQQSEDEQNDMSLQGTSLVYPVLIPNAGDVFLADVGDGREFLFEVTASRRRGVFKETVHEIDYKSIQYATPEILANLAEKTVDTTVFVYDYMQYGQNPLLQEQMYSDLLSLEFELKRIAESYFYDFLSNEYKTLLVPEQESTLYDPYLTNAVLSYFDTSYTFAVRQVRRLNCDDDDVIKCKTIWDALTKRNLPLMQRIGTKIGIVPARSFDPRPMHEGIYHTGIQFVAYLSNPFLSIDAKRKNLPKTLAGSIVAVDPSTQPADLLPPVAGSEYYVFSQKFYEKTDGMSKLETQTWNYLEDRAIDLSDVVEMVSTFPTWTDLERFYFGPVLMILMKALIRSS